jgi:hypothetical protein
MIVTRETPHAANAQARATAERVDRAIDLLKLAEAEDARMRQALEFDALSDVIRAALKKQGFMDELGDNMMPGRDQQEVGLVELNPIVHAILRHVRGEA